MKYTFTLALLCIFAIFARAQSEDQEYTKTLTTRAQKIINTLNIADSEKYKAVSDIMVAQYKGLGKIHDEADARKKEIKRAIENNEKQFLEISALDNSTTAQLFDLHCSYIGALSTHLTNDQIEVVKNGMTYGVVKVTYDSYLSMIPSLKEHEKQQLYAWLVEAREHAMSAASSKAKHEWFGKYKGRFNNYLSANGYDIQAERKAWEERLKQK